MFALIRHGAHSVYPDHLTSEGERMVLALAQRLGTLNTWTRIYASPRLRTQETAAIIGRVLGLSVEVDPSLLETADHGIWMPPHEIAEGAILVTHLPAIREIGNAWAEYLQLPSFPSIGVSEGLLVNISTRRIVKMV
jgi:phosphohistidine phosphatase SixA